METTPAILERIQATLQQSPVLFFFAVHFTLGRTFSLLAGLLAGLHPLPLVGLAWVGDMMNIPFFVTLYELGHRGLRLSPLVARILDRSRQYLERRRFYARFSTMGAVGVTTLAATPLWGCGMWSAIFLAWSMGMKRLPGLVYLSIGSVVGSALVLTLAAGVEVFYRAF